MIGINKKKVAPTARSCSTRVDGWPMSVDVHSIVKATAKNDEANDCITFKQMVGVVPPVAAAAAARREELLEGPVGAASV